MNKKHIEGLLLSVLSLGIVIGISLYPLLKYMDTNFVLEVIYFVIVIFIWRNTVYNKLDTVYF